MSTHDSTGLQSREPGGASFDEDILIAGDGGEIVSNSESAYLVIDAEDEVDAHQLREAIVQQTAIDGDRITIHGGGHHA